MDIAVGQLARLGDVPQGATVAYDYLGDNGYRDVVTVEGPSLKRGRIQVRFQEPRQVPIDGTYGTVDHWSTSCEVKIISLS